jgi:hypothetical protein
MTGTDMGAWYYGRRDCAASLLSSEDLDEKEQAPKDSQSRNQINKYLQ